MSDTKLRKVGGSVLLAIPPAILDALGIGAGSIVDVSLKDGTLVVEPKTRKRYTLDQLIAQCDPTAQHKRDRGWHSAPRTGRELL
ncbi:MAG TPA: AbrB/MazE/SpoVT family DNA-binding domain-containing protein [Rhizomicrobium sp.]|jgi:antitoxin ChpS